MLTLNCRMAGGLPMPESELSGVVPRHHAVAGSVASTQVSGVTDFVSRRAAGFGWPGLVEGASSAAVSLGS